MSKTSFTSSQARSVKLKYKFSRPSSHFSYLLTFKKGSKWQKVKSVKKKGSFKGSKSMSVKKVFAGKAVKLGSYRLKLSCDSGSAKLSFKIVRAAKPAVKPSGSAPANTSLPTISGTARQGQTLTASNGSWSQSPTSYNRQWRRCDSSGAGCSDISGATSSSYVLASADVGHTLRIVVTASNSRGSASASSNRTATVSGLPPANTALPTITGTTTQGQTLTAHNGSWSESPTSFSYQWQRCDSAGSGCSSISGAASSEYVLVYGDAGHTLKVVVTASNSYGSASASSARSPASGTVQGLPPVSIDPPTISGNATQGVRLHAGDGSWSNLPNYSYRWRRCDFAGANCSDIPVATASSYVLKGDDIGSTIRLVVKATNPYGWSEATSASTAVVAAASSFTASGWMWQNPRPQGNSLAAVDFFDTSDGWAVGSDGTILASGDGGDSWELQESPTTSALHAVSFASATEGWIADASGTILATDDGGSTWAEQNTAEATPSLNGVDFVDSDYGWAVGVAGTILRTTDSGANWSRNVDMSDPNLDLFAVDFVNRDYGWAVGSLWDDVNSDQYGVVYVTTNGGDTWSLQYPGSGDTPGSWALESVHFTDVANGQAVGDTGTILVTDDGGDTWSELTIDEDVSFHSTSSASTSTGWAVSGEGAIFKTIDGGASWSPQSSGTSSSLNGVDFVNSDHGWAVGDGGVILRTVDGESWTSLMTSADDDLSSSLMAVAFVNSINGWAADASGTILTTTNGGSSWAKQYGASAGARSYAGVDFSNASDGWAVGADGAIFATDDGGESWNARSSKTSEDLVGVSSVGSSAWAVGSNGTILSNKSGSWQAQSSPVTSSLNAVSFASATEGWIADASGTILATEDGGDSWEKRSTPTTRSLNGIDFVDSDYGWAVDASGTILATTNGGTNWNVQATNPGFELYGVDIVDSTHGWAVGSTWDASIYDDRGVVLRFDGVNWTSETLSNVGELRSVQFSDVDHGCAVGADGAVLVTGNGGDSWNVKSPGALGFFAGVSFVSATRGWVVSAGGTILTTSDGGDSWQAQSSINRNSIFGLAFADLDLGWAVGSHYNAATGKLSGLILSTDNGGTSWSELSEATSRRLKGIDAVDNSNLAWAVGSEGTILSNKSGSWQAQSSPVTSSLNAVSFASATEGWIADASGTVLATDNGGSTWAEQNNTGTTQSLNGIDFVDSDYGWAVGDGGVIVNTVNGGLSWTEQLSYLSTPLLAVKFVDRNHGWVVGAGGVILVTSNGGAIWDLQYSRTTQSLFALDFVVPGGSDPGIYGWIGGERGAILATTNGGVPPGP